MNRILAVANQKGGVGKTTTGINLAASLALARRKVMLIDMDPQANTTSGFGLETKPDDPGIYDVLIGRSSLKDVIRKTESGVDTVCSSRDLVGAEIEMLNLENRENQLRQALEPVRSSYNYILIDCPPALNILTLNALVAANGVIIPTQCEFFALQGLVDLLDTIKFVRQSHNPGLKLDGILRTMYDKRNKLSSEVSEQLKEHFNNLVYRTVIPRNVRLAEAPGHGKPVIEYDNKCSGTIAYMAFTGELLGKEKSL